MPSENELTAALMRLCDDPDASARLHIQAAANHGRMVMLDAAYDASGLTATFTEQTTGAPESQRILTTMCADTPAASAARRIAYAYHDLIGTVGNPPTVTAGLLAQRIAQIAPIVLPESELGAAPPVRVAASAEDPCAFELHSADAHAAPNSALLRFHGTAANGVSCATMWRLEDGYASYAMVDYTAGALNDILVDVLCTLRFYAVRGWV
ncbi:hypothetical protein [Bifidobacterium pseudolongum]|uniref:Uncharacterized protein n=1 Tax=Bifidobacterium pseudolongum subsp. globosum TaxID=1690 RepID=A0AB37X000_9BIFI|nr:hypothetical protein [Bifidobacterium pseudolongum]RYQ36955.1 hypothetical protein PG2002B_1367 [Bifidobacterium pseudolongum subsp. globosum]